MHGSTTTFILENLANSINVNVLTEWETFGQKVKTGLESFTEALTNATEGMDYEDAINLYKKAIELNPKEVNAYILLGNLYANSKLTLSNNLLLFK